jgi:uncharacterized protein YndB with AHSA1/START domain
MTEGKTFTRRVRERMSKTGESYTSARKQVAEKRERNTAARGRLAATDDRPSDEKMREATGKGWDQWFRILDRWGARERTHTQIARHLSGERGVPGWWAQTVTYWYERERGMRLKHERAPGKFEVTATKTIAVPVGVLYDAFVDDIERKKWFPEAVMSVRTATRTKGARFDWEDGSTRVVAWFEAKGQRKSTISMAHEKLPDPGEAETMKAMWRERLVDLKAYLEA